MTALDTFLTKNMNKTAVVIPCYNEEKRLPVSQIKQLLENSDVDIYFANDGSKDNTVGVIQSIVNINPERCFLLDYKTNEGKANVVFKSINQINTLNKYEFVGYFDADFSTPVQEVIRLIKEIETSDNEFVFGARILLLNSGIKRKSYRHYIGRTILTIINQKFSLGIYDTQCGAKLFSKKMIDEAFDKPFYTSWLFDVEIFVRLKQKQLLHLGKEVPIYNWRDVEGSKLSWKSGTKILKEIALLYKNY